MGCSGSKSAVGAVNDSTVPKEVPKPVAFEIALDNNETNGNVAKPPKRFEEAAMNTQNEISKEEIEEKLKKAEERRQELIEERIRNSRLMAEKMFKTRPSIDNDSITSPQNDNRIVTDE